MSAGLQPCGAGEANGLRCGPTRLRQRFIIGQGKVIGRKVWNRAPASQQHRAVIAWRAIWNLIVWRGNQLRLAMQRRAIGQAAGLGQIKLWAEPIDHKIHARLGEIRRIWQVVLQRLPQASVCGAVGRHIIHGQMRNHGARPVDGLGRCRDH